MVQYYIIQYWFTNHKEIGISELFKYHYNIKEKYLTKYAIPHCQICILLLGIQRVSRTQFWFLLILHQKEDIFLTIIINNFFLINDVEKNTLLFGFQ